MWIFSLDVDHLTPEPLELVGGVLRASWKYRSVTIPLQPRPAAGSQCQLCAVCVWLRLTLSRGHRPSWTMSVMKIKDSWGAMRH